MNQIDLLNALGHPWELAQLHQENQVTDRHWFEREEGRTPNSPHRTNSHTDCRICKEQ